MGVLKAILFLTVFILAANISTAYSFDSYNIKYNIVDDRVLVQTVIISAGKGDIILPVPNDAETIELYLNNVKADPIIRNNEVILNLNAADKARLSYITEEYVEKSNFLLNLPIKYDTNFLEITLVLPEEAVLKKPITDISGSIYPKPDKATTDGRSLIFVWERNNLNSGEDVSIFAMYKTRADYSFIVAVSIVILLILSLLSYMFYSKYLIKSKKRSGEEPDITEHLKEEEQQIARILKQRDGECEQGTLRVITGFSKARLSRILMELEARKIIYKEKRGKKNIIFLK